MRLKYSILFFIALTLISYFLVPYQVFWAPLDEFIFIKLNSLLKLGRPIQLICASLNHKYHDWIVDIVYLTLFISYVKKPDLKPRSLKVVESFLVGVTIFFVIFIINKIVFRDLIPISSLSPSLKIEHFQRLNFLLPSFHTKGFSYSSFPGDHATTALLFFFLTAPLFSKKSRIFLFFYTVLIVTPRLIIGAHNFSDIFVGSLSISLIASIMLHDKNFFEQLSVKLYNKFSQLLSKKVISPYDAK